MLPVIAARVKIARAWFSPLALRCGPQPWVIAHGLAPAISRARRVIVAAGTPVIDAAQAGVFAVLSGPSPRMYDR